MHNFANQCLDMARSFLSHNLEAINENGTITPSAGETTTSNESGQAALAIGEYFRSTNETSLDKFDLIDLAARCITAQTFTKEESDYGLALASLGLLAFGPSKDRNLVWERLQDSTRQTLDKRLLVKADPDNCFQALNIAKSVARFSIGLSKKDETSKLIDLFLSRIPTNSSGGFFDANPHGLGGAFNIYGLFSFIFIRQSLEFHANTHLCDYKLPSLRTFAEKYLKILPDIVRTDGLGWSFGPHIGTYGQMACITIILQALHDQWIPEDKKNIYLDLVRRLFFFFFTTFLDQEHGFLVIRDHERNSSLFHTTRTANFSATRHLCQWARLAKAIDFDLSQVPPVPPKTISRYISFDKSSRKEQGLFVYKNADSGLEILLPLISSSKTAPSEPTFSNSLAFPHSPGIFDWPVNKYLPIMLPELTFGNDRVIPSFYGKNCVAGLGLKNTFYFRYDQPDLITVDEVRLPNLGSCKVNWTFCGDKITSEFIFSVKNQTQLDKMRYVLAIAAPHSQYKVGTSLTLGKGSLRASVIKDDFHASWKDTSVVSQNPDYSTYYGKIHYLQTLSRDHPLIMKPNQSYKLIVELSPDIKLVDE